MQAGGKGQACAGHRGENNGEAVNQGFESRRVHTCACMCTSCTAKRGHSLPWGAGPGQLPPCRRRQRSGSASPGLRRVSKVFHWVQSGQRAETRGLTLQGRMRRRGTRCGVLFRGHAQLPGGCRAAGRGCKRSAAQRSAARGGGTHSRSRKSPWQTAPPPCCQGGPAASGLAWPVSSCSARDSLASSKQQGGTCMSGTEVGSPTAPASRAGSGC